MSDRRQKEWDALRVRHEREMEDLELLHLQELIVFYVKYGETGTARLLSEQLQQRRRGTFR